jgi:hypothetical protein
MLEENLQRITYTHSSALGGVTTTVAEMEYEGAVKRSRLCSSSDVGWGHAKLVRGTVRRHRARWRRDEEVPADDDQRTLSAEDLERIAEALKKLRLGIAPFEDPTLHVTDGWSGDLKIESGDVTLHAHWFLDPPAHLEGVKDLLNAIGGF